MKKLITMVLGIAMLCGSAMADEAAVSNSNEDTQEVAQSNTVKYAISPVVNYATFDDLDSETGFGVKGSAENVFAENIVLSTGVSLYNLNNSDLYRIPVTVGYNVKLNELVTVTPKVGADVNILDKDNDDTVNSVGFTGGADLSVKISENNKLFAGVSYSADTINGTNLDGFTYTGGVAIGF